MQFVAFHLYDPLPKGNCNIMALIINIIPRPCSINYGVFIN